MLLDYALTVRNRNVAQASCVVLYINDCQSLDTHRQISSTGIRVYLPFPIDIEPNRIPLIPNLIPVD